MKICGKAQQEYTLNQDAFDNFNRLAANLQMSREKVLWIYLQKHLDGILNYINGHQSQREPIRGRIIDAIVYLSLLDAMIVEKTSTPIILTEKPEPSGTFIPVGRSEAIYR